MHNDFFPPLAYDADAYHSFSDKNDQFLNGIHLEMVIY